MIVRRKDFYGHGGSELRLIILVYAQESAVKVNTDHAAP